MCLAEDASASSPRFTKPRSCALTAVHAQMCSIFDACTCRWELSVSTTAWIPAAVDANPSYDHPHDGLWKNIYGYTVREGMLSNRVASRHSVRNTSTSIELKTKKLKEPRPELQPTWAICREKVVTPMITLSGLLGSWEKFPEPLLQSQISPNLGVQICGINPVRLEAETAAKGASTEL